MSPAAVILIAAVMCSAAIVAWVYIAERLDPPRRDPFADPADRTDPDGDKYIASLAGNPGEPDWWDQEAPRPSAVEILPGHAGGPRPAADEDDPAIDITGQLPSAVCTWGKTADELAGELAAKYLAAPDA